STAPAPTAIYTLSLHDALPICYIIVLLADDFRRQNPGAGSQRINRRENPFLGNLTLKVGRGIQVSKCRRRSRIRIVIRRNVNRLNRSNGTFLRRSNPLLKLTHLCCKRRLVTYRRRHTPKEGGNLRTRLSKAENVVDKEKYVAPLLITEIFRHRKSGQGYA